MIVDVSSSFLPWPSLYSARTPLSGKMRWNDCMTAAGVGTAGTVFTGAFQVSSRDTTRQFLTKCLLHASHVGHNRYPVLHTPESKIRLGPHGSLPFRNGLLSLRPNFFLLRDLWWERKALGQRARMVMKNCFKVFLEGSPRD